MGAIGADVKNWSYKTDCCGGSLAISKTSIVVDMCDKLMSAAKEAGANCVVTACPLCMANLDMRPVREFENAGFLFHGIDFAGDGAARIGGNF